MASTPSPRSTLWDVEGLTAAVLLPTRGLAVAGVEFNDRAFASAVTRGYNDWLYDYCSQDPGRLYGAAMVLLEDVDDAISEIKRSRKDLAFKGVFARPNPVAQPQLARRHLRSPLGRLPGPGRAHDLPRGIPL